MSFNTILSQDHVINYFKRAIEISHLTHAYIFTGQTGVGKSLFTKEFVKALICKKNINGHCDACHNCDRIDALDHPDIHWEILDKRDRFIKIERIRNLQYKASLCPVELSYKIFIIKDAEKMNEEAANCLLKTIEEPTSNTLFILITNSLSGLNETIISRCQVIRFKPIQTRVIKEYLMKKFSKESDEIVWAANYCCGSLGQACTLLNGAHFQKNSDVINRILRLNKEQNLSCAEEFVHSALTPSRSLEEGRQSLRYVLNCVLRYYRDLLLFKIMRRDKEDFESLPIFNTNHTDSLKLQSTLFSQETIMKIINELLLTIEYLDCNVNIPLLIENLITKISEASNLR